MNENKQNKNFIGVARVTSVHFENVFNKKNNEYSKDEISEMVNNMFDLRDEKDNIEQTNEKTKTIVKITDFVIGCAKEQGMTGSELFSLLLSKDKIINQ